MALTRANALTYVAGEFASLLSGAGLTAADTQAGVKSVLDNAFRKLGIAQADLPAASVAGSLIADAEALLDYYTLLRLETVTATAIDISKGTAGTTVSKKRSQLHTQLAGLVLRAKRIAEGLGYDLSDAESARYDFNLDFLEPAGTGVG